MSDHIPSNPSDELAKYVAEICARYAAQTGQMSRAEYAVHALASVLDEIRADAVASRRDVSVLTSNPPQNPLAYRILNVHLPVRLPSETNDEVTPHGVIYDKPGWLCSQCGGWNHLQDKFCTHTHPRAALKAVCAHGVLLSLNESCNDCENDKRAAQNGNPQ